MKARRDTLKTGRDTLRTIDTTAAVADTSAKRFSYRTMSNSAFSVGERLIFDVNFGFVTAGEAIMEVAGYDYHKERQCYRIQFQVRSLPFFSTFYKVEDWYLTLMDVEGLFPWRFEQHIREGGYRRDFMAEFDHENGLAITTDGKDYPIPTYVHDIVSAFYFTRTLDFTGFRVGQKVYLQNFYKDSTYNLEIKYRGKQTVKVEAGTFRCIIVEPLVERGGLFKSEGSILVWLTDDEKRLPVQVSSKIIIGSITAELREYYGISSPIRARVE